MCNQQKEKCSFSIAMLTNLNASGVPTFQHFPLSDTFGIFQVRKLSPAFLLAFHILDDKTCLANALTIVCLTWIKYASHIIPHDTRHCQQQLKFIACTAYKLKSLSVNR